MTSSLPIAELCERLRQAYVNRDADPGDNLRPGLDAETYRAAWAAHGIDPPADLVALYQWHDGNADVDAEYALCFRDNVFISLEHSLEEYRRLCEPNLREQTLELSGLDLARCVPIAAYEGCVYVLAIDGHAYGRKAAQPVVQVFEDVAVYFYSLRSMLQTCQAWVAHPDWTKEGLLDEEDEIWERYNPGVFSNADD